VVNPALAQLMPQRCDFSGTFSTKVGMFSTYVCSCSQVVQQGSHASDGWTTQSCDMVPSQGCPDCMSHPSTNMYAPHDLLTDATPSCNQLFNSTVLCSAAATSKQVPSPLLQSEVRSTSAWFTSPSHHRQMKVACMSTRAASPG